MRAISTQAPNDAPRPLAPWAWLAMLLALGIGVPFLPVNSLAAAVAGAIVVTILYVVAAVQIASSMARLELPMPRLVLWFFIALMWWGLGQWIAIDRIIMPFNDVAREVGGGPASWQWAVARFVRTITGLALLAASALGGSIVGRLIKTPNMLGPVCAVIALIDIWGVLLGGIVSQLLTNPATAETSRKIMAAPPTVGEAVATTATQAFRLPLPAIGAGDYLFLGLLFSALHLNRMNWRGAEKLITPLVVLALLSITLSDVFLGHEIMLPGLVFIGLGAALPNSKYFQFTREEKFALFYAGIFVILLTAGLYFGITSQLKN